MQKIWESVVGQNIDKLMGGGGGGGGGEKYYYVSNVLFEWPLITYITYVITFIIRYHYCFYDILYRY